MSESPPNLLICLVLAEGVDRPDGCWDPSDERDLKDEAEHTGEGPFDGEEGKPGKQECNDQSHVDPC